MKTTRSAELLYDSETTLRMVDELLDDLGMRGPDPSSHPSPALLQTYEGADADRAPRAAEIFWQIEEALEELRDARRKASTSAEGSATEQVSLLQAVLAGTEARLSHIARRLAR